MAEYADERLGPDDLKPRLRIDGCLGFRDITGDLAGQMAQLAPFGIGNPRRCSRPTASRWSTARGA